MVSASSATLPEDHCQLQRGRDDPANDQLIAPTKTS
jgi:hypothetical protein